MNLTKDDLQAISQLIDTKLEPVKKQVGNLHLSLESVRVEVADIKEQIKFLPTKDEFYGRMDELIGEVKEYRQERAFLSNRVDRLEERVEALEN